MGNFLIGYKAVTLQRLIHNKLPRILDEHDEHDEHDT